MRRCDRPRFLLCMISIFDVVTNFNSHFTRTRGNHYSCAETLAWRRQAARGTFPRHRFSAAAALVDARGGDLLIYGGCDEELAPTSGFFVLLTGKRAFPVRKRRSNSTLNPCGSAPCMLLQGYSKASNADSLQILFPKKTSILTITVICLCDACVHKHEKWPGGTVVGTDQTQFQKVAGLGGVSNRTTNIRWSSFFLSELYKSCIALSTIRDGIPNRTPYTTCRFAS